MPVMDGAELVAAVREMRPELPVVVVSGLAEYDFQLQGIDPDGISLRPGPSGWRTRCSGWRRRPADRATPDWHRCVVSGQMVEPTMRPFWSHDRARRARRRLALAVVAGFLLVGPDVAAAERPLFPTPARHDLFWVGAAMLTVGIAWESLSAGVPDGLDVYALPFSMHGSALVTVGGLMMLDGLGRPAAGHLWPMRRGALAARILFGVAHAAKVTGALIFLLSDREVAVLGRVPAGVGVALDAGALTVALAQLRLETRPPRPPGAPGRPSPDCPFYGEPPGSRRVALLPVPWAARAGAGLALAGVF